MQIEKKTFLILINCPLSPQNESNPANLIVHEIIMTIYFQFSNN